MHPESKAPAPSVNGNGRENVSTAANLPDVPPTVEPFKLPRDIGVSVIRDALATAFADHSSDFAAPLRKRLYAAATPLTVVDRMVAIARVRWGKYRFEFDPEGDLAIVAGIFENSRHLPVDLAAFHPTDESLRRVYRGPEFALGMSDALFDARFHPQRRVLVHASVWSWLRSECCGAVPIDWNKTALHLKEWGAGGVTAENDDEARRIDMHMRLALKAPPIFVKRHKVAA